MEQLKSLERLIESFNKLPSVGKKSAERMAYSMLDMSEEDIKEFSLAINNIKEKIHTCPVCGCLTEKEKCDICSDHTRDKSTILVVSYPKDIMVFEKAERYCGVYHVLGGVISMTKGISADDLKIQQLLERAEDINVKEIIIATSPTIEGETTALYLAKLLESNSHVKVTRIAYGLPMGANLDYADSLTLSKALEGRINLK